MKPHPILIIIKPFYKMLSDTKLNYLQQLVQNASREEIIWTKGYLAGFLEGSKNEIQIPVIASTENVAVKPLIIYGTETGNSKKVASQLLANFKKNKIQAKAIDVFQYDTAKLEKETIILFVMSTQGEGEFPQNAIQFYNYLQKNDLDLQHISFAVLGLGDSSYPLFCHAGVLLDEILSKRGAKRLLPLVKSDVDFAPNVLQWEQDLQQVFKQQTTTEVVISKMATTTSHKKSYVGKINNKIILNDIGSNKKTYHIEIVTEEEVLYEPGDALGIIPKNSKEDTQAIMNYFQADAQKLITINGEQKTVENWLQEKNIKGLSKRSLEQLGHLLQAEITFERADLIDVLQVYPKPDSFQIENLLEILLPIAPRLYSIASSNEAHDGEVHLTVNLNTFNVSNQLKTGLASQFLADFPLHEPLDFYIHKNQNFRLPKEDTDIIMIGPGTGIAPFRSFLSQRDASGAEGKNWLFFGEQHFVHDFYYQTEIQEWIATGVLTKLDTAFSRDQERKIYVQDRIKEKAKEFNAWLENGAHLYICGQKNPMSADVEEVIVEVLSQERNIATTEAKQILEELEATGKYQKDVY
ncbi:sulfite reductase flavoprotein subunit alpha [Flavobacterium sp. NRK F7]|uniref:diflavin oxidoreductase n=1 Tax=Flavobacterium sp. NRK F7 TaxID=2954930 RepID=UPI002091D973|nr:flavodoxin domain-containing protein [Flavobacterium sp. NRK F7]MCO6161289.1 flavodoxin domain-containing protein [Flavobacterium sp. NRK F7]